MQSLSWYLHRLRRMSPAELAYRVSQAGRGAADRLTLNKAPAPTPLGPPPSVVFARGARDVDVERYREDADAMLGGRYSFFDLEACELGATPNWNRDPLTGREAPLAHSSTLDYRDERLVGNIKYLWEPNRHLHLPRFAQAYALTGDARYARALMQHLDSWFEQCPVGRGPNWSSSLELAIRLINWSLAWQWIGGYRSEVFAGEEGRAFRERWLRSVHQHVRAIARKLSRYSSANNHLIGEAAGVWIASVTWGCWREVRTWGLKCKAVLLDEAFKQNAPDGGNREQAFSYQQFVLDFLILSGLAARACSEDFPREFWSRIERMLEFIAAMMDSAGRLPMVGDADDGYVVGLSPPDAQSDNSFDNFRSLLATGALLFERGDFAMKAGALDDKTRWLLGDSCEADYERLRVRGGRPTPPRSFPDSGYYLLGDHLESTRDIRLLVDAGPLGYLSIAAHGHADALSVVLNVAGREVLVDPGTYSYHTEPAWRRYFRSTRAHNTVLVDDRDQSEQSGAFMWSHHARAHCRGFEIDASHQRFSGEHDGYHRLSDPVTHRRDIAFEAASNTFTIIDVLTCKAAHKAVRCWHFAEDLAPQAVGGEIVVDVGAYRIRLVSEARPDRVHTFRGGGPGEGGWVSRSFHRKEPATSIFWESDIEGATTLKTQIYCELRETEVVRPVRNFTTAQSFASVTSRTTT